jgi:hypothetical protein
LCANCCCLLCNLCVCVVFVCCGFVLYSLLMSSHEEVKRASGGAQSSLADFFPNAGSECMLMVCVNTTYFGIK